MKKIDIDKVLTEHIKKDEEFQEKINRVLFGEPDTEEIGMVKQNKEMYVILTASKNVQGFFGKIGSLSKWIFIVVGLLGLLKGWWVSFNRLFNFKMKDISLLLPKVQDMAHDFLNHCKAQGLNVVLTSTYRNEEEQNALYAQGRTAAGNVVTNAKFSQSMHNYKCAVDFAPVDSYGNINWNDKSLFMKIADIGVSCGFEAGAYWTSFLDLPHLQYTAGYTLDDFQNNRIDLSKFASQTPQNATKHVFTVPLTFGMTNNDDVRAMQDILRKEGCFVGLSTGNYFDATAGAVLIYQLMHHLAPSADLKTLGGKRVGALTIASLNK